MDWSMIRKIGQAWWERVEDQETGHCSVSRGSSLVTPKEIQNCPWRLDHSYQVCDPNHNWKIAWVDRITSLEVVPTFLIHFSSICKMGNQAYLISSDAPWAPSWRTGARQPVFFYNKAWLYYELEVKRLVFEWKPKKYHTTIIDMFFRHWKK